MRSRAKDKLLRSIEFSRERLNGYVDRKELNSDEIIELSRKLDRLINSYYHASAQVEVGVSHEKAKTKAKVRPKTIAKANIKKVTPHLNNEPMQKYILMSKRDLQHIPDIPIETPYPRILKIGDKEYTLIKLF